MKDYHTIWMRITALARQTPEEPVGAPSPGFVTRVVARAFAAPTRPDEFFARYALRAFGLAAALAVVCAATNVNLIAGDTLTEGFAEDPVGEFITQL